MMTVQMAPLVEVELDGSPLAAAEASRLVRVLVQQRLSLPTLCELTFTQPGGPFQSLSSWSWGLPVRVRVGEPARLLFLGEITAFEFSAEPALGQLLRVRCYDRMHRLRKRCPQRVHVETTLAELARELTADLGISIDASAPSLLWRRLIQHSQNDLQLLQRVCQLCGAYFWLEDETLRLFRLDDPFESLLLGYGQELLEVSLELNADQSVAEVRSQGWDPWLAEAHGGRADRPRSSAGSVDLDARVFGEDCRANLTNRAFQQDEQAQAAAQSELDRRAGESVVVSGIASGDPRLRPGVAIRVERLQPALPGEHVVCAASHHIDARRGHRSEFSTRTPRPFEAPGAVEVGMGVVTQVDDPQGLGRVKVELISCGGLESDWLQVVAPGAGSEKGLVMVPDVGDRVMVVFVESDAAQGVVLGGLFGPDGAPDSGVDEGRVKRFSMRSHQGQLLRFDDREGTLRLENSQGSFVELRPEKILLHAEGDLEIEAPGKKLILRASRVDFQQA